jgi:hypothetical protein
MSMIQNTYGEKGAFDSNDQRVRKINNQSLLVVARGFPVSKPLNENESLLLAWGTTVILTLFHNKCDELSDSRRTCTVVVAIPS